MPDLVADSPDVLPMNPSQAKRWTKAVRERLATWVRESAKPALTRALRAVEGDGEVTVEGTDIFVSHVPLNERTGYVHPDVKLEFGARATGEPSAVMPIVCDAAPHVAGVEFPTAEPRVMRAERTFWEKATTAHVYCRQRRLRSACFARQWHDLVRLDEVGVVDRALADRRIADEVAAHKAAFFRERDASKSWVDYRAAVAGDLQLVPVGESLAALADDYARMVEDGFVLDDAEPFDALMDACEAIADRANRRD